MTPPPRKAAIYRRISDDREGLELGVARQADDCRALAQEHGWTVVADYPDDDIGASTRSRKPRPQYDQMVTDAKAGHFSVIVAYSSSRITRRPRENEDLIELAERHGIRFAYVRSPSFDLNTADGRHIARMLAANDAAEAERTGERVRRTFVQKMRAGEYRGGPRPFGFEADGVTLRPIEAAAIEAATHDVIGGVALYEISQRWNDAHLAPSGKGRWQPSTVRQVLMRARNAGLIESYGEVVAPAAWPAVVTEDVWRAACAVLRDPARRTAAGNQPRWIGSGLYLCGGCGQPSVRVTGRAKYRCDPRFAGPSDVGHVQRGAGLVDAFVEAAIIARLGRPDAVDLLPRGGKVDTRAIHRERSTVAALLAELDDDRDHERITRARYLARNEKLAARLADADRHLAQAEQRNPLSTLPLGDPDAVAALWDDLELTVQRAALQAVATVTLVKMPVGWKPRRKPESPADLGIRIRPK